MTQLKIKPNRRRTGEYKRNERVVVTLRISLASKKIKRKCILKFTATQWCVKTHFERDDSFAGYVMPPFL